MKSVETAIGRPPAYVGIDVGKLTLDVFAPKLRLRVPNDSTGHGRLLASARKCYRRPHFVCEGGSYCRALLRFLRAKRCNVSVANPYRVRQFAKATGQIAKTDPLDAETLALFGRTFRPAATPTPDPTIEELQQVVRRRNYLVDLLTSQNIQRKFVEDRGLMDGVDRLMEALRVEISALDARAESIVERDLVLASKRDAFSSVHGVGRQTAIQLLAEMPELGRLDRGQAASLAGLAPMNRDSGSTTGIRSIRGGRLPVRRALYMAAFVASRRKGVLGRFYRRLRARGKPFRVAITAAMRKLLIYLNSRAREVDLRLQDEHGRLRAAALHSWRATKPPKRPPAKIRRGK